MTSRQLQTSLFEESEVWTLSVADFRAKLSQLQETDEVSKILEELYFLKSLGSHLFSDLAIYSLRTLKDSSIIKKGILSRPCSESWMNWGYDVEWQVLNSKDFGVPQNRERVFIIGHLRGECTRRIFPIERDVPETNRKRHVDFAVPVLTPNRLEKRQNGRRFKTNGEPMFTLTAQDQHGILLQDKKLKIREATTKGYAEAKIGDSVNIANINSKTKRGRVGNQIANTLLASEQQGVVGSDYRIRRLTPRECWRLQGFPDSAFDKAQAVTSNSQLYKQAGNSVTVNVIAEIAKYFKEDEQ